MLLAFLLENGFGRLKPSQRSTVFPGNAITIAYLSTLFLWIEEWMCQLYANFVEKEPRLFYMSLGTVVLQEDFGTRFLFLFQWLVSMALILWSG